MDEKRKMPKGGTPRGGSPKKLERIKSSPRMALEPLEVEARYPIMAGTLANKRSKGEGPVYFKVGRKIIYRPEDIEAYLFSNPIQTVDSHRDLR